MAKCFRCGKDLSRQTCEQCGYELSAGIRLLNQWNGEFAFPKAEVSGSPTAQGGGSAGNAPGTKVPYTEVPLGNFQPAKKDKQKSPRELDADEILALMNSNAPWDDNNPALQQVREEKKAKKRRTMIKWTIGILLTLAAVAAVVGLGYLQISHPNQKISRFGLMAVIGAVVAAVNLVSRKTNVRRSVAVELLTLVIAGLNLLAMLIAADYRQIGGAVGSGLGLGLVISGIVSVVKLEATSFVEYRGDWDSDRTLFLYETAVGLFMVPWVFGINASGLWCCLIGAVILAVLGWFNAEYWYMGLLSTVMLFSIAIALISAVYGIIMFDGIVKSLCISVAIGGVWLGAMVLEGYHNSSFICFLIGAGVSAINVFLMLFIPAYRGIGAMIGSGIGLANGLIGAIGVGMVSRDQKDSSQDTRDIGIYLLLTGLLTLPWIFGVGTSGLVMFLIIMIVYSIAAFICFGIKCNKPSVWIAVFVITIVLVGIGGHWFFPQAMQSIFG